MSYVNFKLKISRRVATYRNGSSPFAKASELTVETVTIEKPTVLVFEFVWLNPLLPGKWNYRMPRMRPVF